jgi:hypothetical protein
VYGWCLAVGRATKGGEAMLTKTRLSFGDLARELGKEFSRGGRPLGRSYLDRLIRDLVELHPLETVGGSRLWDSSALEQFRNAVRRDREARR